MATCFPTTAVGGVNDDVLSPFDQAARLLTASIEADEQVRLFFGDPSMGKLEDHAADLRALCETAWMALAGQASLPPFVCRAAGHVVTVLLEIGEAPHLLLQDARSLGAITAMTRIFEMDHAQTMATVAEATGWLVEQAGVRPTWTAESVVDDAVAAVREQVGEHGKVLCGLSGGVDSAVAAALVQRAVGDRLVCVFVDHGLLRAGEAEQVETDFVAATGARLVVVDAAETFLRELAGVVDPEEKRRVVGREFIRAFERAEADLVAEAEGAGEPVRFLVQGTLYPDVVESGGGSGAATIKSHHNVGGLPDDLGFELVEPLRLLFKDEVRAAGRLLGLPEEIVGRQPFPGPGLAIRVVGEVSAENLRVLRAADAIARAELTAAGLDDEVWQCPVVLLADVRSVGVQGDGRTYGHPVVLRPVSSEDAMTADWTRVPYDVLARISTRITNEVPEVNRVVLDVTSKPPGTIEWE